MTQYKPTRFQFPSTDGLQIACTKWEGKGEARGVVQIAHGLGEHIGRYAELTEILVRDELAVYGNDHRGHGLTARADAPLGEFGPGGFDQLVDDMVALRVIAKNEHFRKPYILLGHGMGSFAAQQFIMDHGHSIDGLVLTGTGTLDGLVRTAQGISKPEDWRRIMNAPFEPARTPFDWLSRDKREVDLFMSDSLCFPSLSQRSMESFLDAFGRLSDPKELGDLRKDLPIYIMAGSDDPVGQKLEGVHLLTNRYRGAGFTAVTCDTYPGARHELFHETNRREIFADLLVWISAILRPPR